MTANYRNWAGNYSYTAAEIHRPLTLDEIREIVIRSRKVRVLGSRHSFNSIADCDENLISLEHFNHIVEIDRARKTVTVEAGMKYGQLGEYLHREGFSLHNLASLPHISVAGACATATHGSGEKNGNLATAVVAMELINANGEIVTLSRDQHGENFNGMVVALGGLGIVTKLTLEIAPTFTMRQDVYDNLALKNLEENFDAIQASAYSVSLFTDWQNDRINQVWLKRRDISETAAPTFFGATLAQANRHPIAEVSAENCTPQMDVPGPWHERLPHFRMDFLPSVGDELQSEYFVPRHHAVAAIRAVAKLREQIAPLILISEIRTIAADKLWMSPCYEQASVAIHFTWKQNWPAVCELLPIIEEKLAPFDARPHWGKLFTIPPARVQSLYKKLPEFRELLSSFDLQGKFRNAFLDTYVYEPRRH
jgi:xylitol oxidase